MKQLIFVCSMVHMLLCASLGTLILTYLSPEKLVPTRLNWLTDPTGIIFGVVVVAIASVVPFAMILIIDSISYKEGRVDATREVSKKYFLVNR